MRLIDADRVGEGMAETWQKVLVEKTVSEVPTIDPETLPIVQELREKIKQLYELIAESRMVAEDKKEAKK